MKKNSVTFRFLVSLLVAFTVMVSLKLLLDFRKELKRTKASMGFVPTEFDLRDIGWSTDARAQNWGTCWIFSTFSSLESNLLVNKNWKKSGEKGPVDLSEYHMDKFNSFTRAGHDSHRKNDWYSGQGGNFPGGNHDDINTGAIVHLGGDYRMAASILTTNRGAVQERLTPTIKSNSDHSVFGDKPWEGVLFENNYTYFVPSDIEFLTLQGTIKAKREAIKRAIVQYGAVASAQHMDDDPIGISDDKEEIHMYRGDKKVNHAISLIGWDDDFEFKEHRGAWLVKDSDHKDEKTKKHIGHFWVLYDDVHVGKDAYMGGVSFRGVKKREYDYVYTHSFHGWRYNTNKNSEIKEVGNLFKVNRDERIHSIGVYTTRSNVDVSLKIYSEVKGILLGKENASFTYPGFHRVKLKKPIKVSKGKTFFVTQNNSNGVYAFESSFTLDVLLSELPKWGEPVDINSKASKNESFYFDGNKWIDFSSYKNQKSKQVKNRHAASSDSANITLNVYTVK
ncbi:MAG: DUF4082 domain-containing protein [Bacteriovoracaceae bacterium]|nr:DUF4082 domain-containing protein [Bacteriovoracaceae bacterium]